VNEAAEYESRNLSELTVDKPDGTGESFKGVRVMLLPGGALRVYRSPALDDAVPFEAMFPHQGWTRYYAYPEE
jgi:hypothetical protein